MATQQLKRTPEQDEAFRPTREFLSAHGVTPDAHGEYREDDILAVLRAKGWDATIEPETDPPGWGAEITRPYSPGVMQSAYGLGADRISALIDALGDSMTLITAEESERLFDEMARQFLGLSGKEFMEKYRAGELDFDDSRVVHLHVARPHGW